MHKKEALLWFSTTKIRLLIFKIRKSARRDSNPRPQPWQGCTPPTEPLALITRIVFGTSLAEKSITQSFTIVNKFFLFFISSTIYLICINCMCILGKSHKKEPTLLDSPPAAPLESGIYTSAAARSLGEFLCDREFQRNFLSHKKVPHTQIIRICGSYQRRMSMKHMVFCKFCSLSINI